MNEYWEEIPCKAEAIIGYGERVDLGEFKNYEFASRALIAFWKDRGKSIEDNGRSSLLRYQWAFKKGLPGDLAAGVIIKTRAEVEEPPFPLSGR